VRETPIGATLVTRYEAVDQSACGSAFLEPLGYRDADDPSGPPRFDPGWARLTSTDRNWILFPTGEAHYAHPELITKLFNACAVRVITPTHEASSTSCLEPALDARFDGSDRRPAYSVPEDRQSAELQRIPEGDSDHGKSRAAAAIAARRRDPQSDRRKARSTRTEKAIASGGYIRELCAATGKQTGDSLARRAARGRIRRRWYEHARR